jgi:ubiquinone/menaquinone biosynthesis C-methylase UbiE
VAAAVAAALHRGAGRGRVQSGGILIDDARAYDRMSRLLLGSLFGPIAADIAAAAGDDARLLEVGCGPGHLSIRLARDHGLDVTGLDLDPAMIERARANAERARANAERTLPHADNRPDFVAGDVAALPFADESFDLVVSTLSMHHWADPTAGLNEIGRVLRPGGRALIWDIRPGGLPFHPHPPDPVAHADDSSLRLVSAGPWRWPWRLSLAQRVELVRP